MVILVFGQHGVKEGNGMKNVYLKLADDGTVIGFTFVDTGIFLQEVPKNVLIRDVVEATGFNQYVLKYVEGALIEVGKRQVELSPVEKVVDALNVQLAELKHKTEVLEEVIKKNIEGVD